ncbi:MAG: FAD-binding protein [Actinobacteria bacterium]|nr:FAD-binding protein [Actinomycetota bacterium]
MSEQIDVAIIGAGLAGLSCAKELKRNNIDFHIFESTDSVGGRVKTDNIDGFLLDRGFQLYNPSYSEGKKVLDYEKLNLKSFTPGVAIRDKNRLRVITDPLRSTDYKYNFITQMPGSLREKIGLLSYFLKYLIQSDAQIAISKDISSLDALSKSKINKNLLNKLLRPFLQGVFLESELATSRKFLDVVLKTFLQGTPSVPEKGMQQIPLQLAETIGIENITFNSRVEKITENSIFTNNKEIKARKIVVASDPIQAISWLNLPIKKMNSVSTWYFKANQEVANILKSLPILFVDADNSGPLTNAVVLTNASKSYAPQNEVLVSASSIYPFEQSSTEEIKNHCAKLFGVDTKDWELIKKYEIKDALPQMKPPFTLIDSNKVTENLFVCGDHRATSSINGAFLSGRNTATSVKVSLGL